MNYLSIKQTSIKWGLCPRRIQVLCANNRIPGAFMVGNTWILPADAVKPKDERIKTGKYIGYHQKYKKRHEEKLNMRGPGNE